MERYKQPFQRSGFTPPIDFSSSHLLAAFQLNAVNTSALQEVEHYKQAFQRSGGTPLIDYYRALVDGMVLGTTSERCARLGLSCALVQ